MASPSLAPGRDIPVEIRSYLGKTSIGRIDIAVAPFNTRLKRALATLAIWWLAAVLAILVPLLHWVLVPTLALLGPILALRSFSRDRTVSGGSGACPSCGDALRFSGAARPEAFTHACPTCRQSLDITALPPSAPPV